MKVAFLLKGAISKATGRSASPGGVYRKGEYVNFVGGAKSIQKHIIEANPDCEFDFFLHSWHPNLENELVSLYNPVKYLFEDNSEYNAQLLHLLKNTKTQKGYYGQASMCLSFKKVSKLLQSYVKETHEKYDLVIFYRYDLLLWKDMRLSEYSPENLYVAGDDHGRCISDFHFVMNYDNAIQFGIELYDTISKENPPRDHRVIKGYVDNIMKNHLVMDNIIAGKDQEVIRKLMAVLVAKRISVPTLESFGITVKELLTYKDGCVKPEDLSYYKERYSDPE